MNSWEKLTFLIKFQYYFPATLATLISAARFPFAIAIAMLRCFKGKWFRTII